MDTKVNLRGMINLDQVEDLLSEVLSRMDAQDKNLQAVNESIKGLMPRQSAERCIDELHDAVRVLSGRVDAVREASVARVDNKLYVSMSTSVNTILPPLSLSLSHTHTIFHLLSYLLALLLYHECCTVTSTGIHYVPC